MREIVHESSTPLRYYKTSRVCSDGGVEELLNIQLSAADAPYMVMGTIDAIIRAQVDRSM